MKVERSVNRLYMLVIEVSKPSCLISKVEEPSWLWNTRDGHVNFQAMGLMVRNDLVNGVPELIQSNEPCKGCLMSKQPRKPFPQQANFSATKALELIHGDLCGLISPPTKAGNQYFFIFVDDYSRMMWVYILLNKDETYEVFKKLKAMVENEREEKIKVFRSDRGVNSCQIHSLYIAKTLVLRDISLFPILPNRMGWWRDAIEQSWL